MSKPRPVTSQADFDRRLERLEGDLAKAERRLELAGIRTQVDKLQRRVGPRP